MLRSIRLVLSKKWVKDKWLDACYDTSSLLEYSRWPPNSGSEERKHTNIANIPLQHNTHLSSPDLLWICVSIGTCGKLAKCIWGPKLIPNWGLHRHAMLKNPKRYKCCSTKRALKIRIGPKSKELAHCPMGFWHNADIWLRTIVLATIYPDALLRLLQ